MTEIGAEVEISLKSIYGEKWREALLVHLLIGLGRSIVERSRTLGSRGEEQVARNKCADEADEETFKELHENPLGYMRLMNEKLADEMESQLRRSPRGPVKDDPERVFPELGELVEAIGTRALMKLEEDIMDDDGLAGLLESIIQVSWDEASLTVREDTLRIIRLLTLFSAHI